MSDWEAYRSREIIFVKPRTGPNQEDQVRTKDGQVMPREVLLRKYEKLEHKED